MSSGFIRLVGENFPEPTKKISIPTLRKELVFIPQQNQIVEKINYSVIIRCANRQITLFSSYDYHKTEHEYKKLVTTARKENTVVEIDFMSNDYIVEKYKRE